MEDSIISLSYLSQIQEDLTSSKGRCMYTIQIFGITCDVTSFLPHALLHHLTINEERKQGFSDFYIFGHTSVLLFIKFPWMMTCFYIVSTPFEIKEVVVSFRESKMLLEFHEH